MKFCKLLTVALTLSGSFIITACGPVIKLFEVDMKVPALRPLNFDQKNIAVFSNINKDNDSLIMVNLATGLSASLEKALSLNVESIPVFNIHSDSSTVWDTGYIQSLSQKSNSDIVMVIKKQVVGKTEVFKTDRFPSGQQVQSSNIFVPFKSFLDVYDGVSAEKLASISQTDTIIWEVLSRNEMRDALLTPRIYKSLLNASKEIGKNLSDNFFDQWESVQRYLYVYDNEKWLNAYVLSQDFKWSQAMDIWLKDIESSDRIKASCAAFNLAIACEMTGKRDIALEWLDYANSCYTLSGISEYKSLLKNQLEKEGDSQKKP